MACDCIDKMRVQLSERMLKEKGIDTIGLPALEYVFKTDYASGNWQKMLWFKAKFERFTENGSIVEEAIMFSSDYCPFCGTRYVEEKENSDE